MSYKKIVVPLSVSGIQKIQDELKEYKLCQKDKAKELAERLAMLGASVASIRFSRAVYTGMRDATVSVVAIPNGYAVKADGESVLFIEFGAGITYGTGHPEASEFGMGAGTYPKAGICPKTRAAATHTEILLQCPCMRREKRLSRSFRESLWRCSVLD